MVLALTVAYGLVPLATDSNSFKFVANRLASEDTETTANTLLEHFIRLTPLLEINYFNRIEAGKNPIQALDYALELLCMQNLKTKHAEEVYTSVGLSSKYGRDNFTYANMEKLHLSCKYNANENTYDIGYPSPQTVMIPTRKYEQFNTFLNNFARTCEDVIESTRYNDVDQLIR